MPSADFKCVFCHADVVATTTRILAPIENDAPIMVFTDVPCEKCAHCGYVYLKPATTHKLIEQARASIGTIRSQYVHPVQAKLVAFQP